MDIASIRPSSVDGIKQLAKKISRERDVPHTRALDDASRQAGYENFVHAKRRLKLAAVPPRFPIYLSVHWFAPRGRTGELTPDGLRAGREILRVDLSRPLVDIVAKHRVGQGRGLHGFRMEYSDHLEHRTNVLGQDEARDRLLAGARSLLFMEATGLQPVTTKQFQQFSDMLENLPGADHNSDWFDPVTAAYIRLDEPYADSIESVVGKRRQWLERRGLHMVAPQWEGIYYAGECMPFLISPNGGLLTRAAEALAKVPAVTKPETWPHETGMCNDDFVSPQRQADDKPRRPRPGPSWRDHQGATPYGGAPGIPSRWRPAKPMAFAQHQQLGPLMQGLCSSAWPRRVSQKLSAARSELEEWAIKEHKSQQGDAVYDIYYGGPRAVYGNSDAELMVMLTNARGLVERGYSDCKPRRKLLAAFEAATNEMEKRRTEHAPSSRAGSAV